MSTTEPDGPVEGSWPIGGAALRTRRVGSGPPVLLTHGVPGDADTLAPVADLLADRWTAITVTLRHSGPGPHGHRGFGTTEQRDDLRQLIDALGLGPVHLVAWSYSAHAALGLAVSFPSSIRSLLVYEPGFPTFVVDDEALDAVHRDTLAAFGPVFAALADGDADAAVRRSIDAAAGEPGAFDRQAPRVREIQLRNAHTLALLASQSPPIQLDVGALRSIEPPTTVAWGAGTRTCYRIVSEAAGRLVPGARAVAIPGHGHLLPEQDPTAFAGIVRQHLDRAERIAGTNSP